MRSVVLGAVVGMLLLGCASQAEFSCTNSCEECKTASLSCVFKRSGKIDDGS